MASEGKKVFTDAGVPSDLCLLPSRRTFPMVPMLRGAVCPSTQESAVAARSQWTPVVVYVHVDD